MLCRRRVIEYNVGTNHVPTPSTMERCNIDRQESLEKTIKVRCNTSTLTIPDTTFPKPRPLEKSEKKNTISMCPVKKFTLTPPSNVMTKKEMEEICRKVLNTRIVEGTSSSKDLNELLCEINNFEQRPRSGEKNKIRERSFSTPMLDIYDVLPPKGKEVNEPENESDDENDIPVYDNPVSKTKVTHQRNGNTGNTAPHSDTVYLLPIQGKTEQYREPSYINARQNFML